MFIAARTFVLLCASAVVGLSSAKASEAPAKPQIQSPYPTPIYTEHRRCVSVLNGSMFMRTELLFGMSRASGPDITESEFQSFIDDQVTPRFPDGLTVLSGNGQFRDSSGTIVQEKSKLLILLYPFTRASSQKVDEIRTEYLATFQQQSVLRTDEEQCVSF